MTDVNFEINRGDEITGTVIGCNSQYAFIHSDQLPEGSVLRCECCLNIGDTAAFRINSYNINARGYVIALNFSGIISYASEREYTLGNELYEQELAA